MLIDLVTRVLDPERARLGYRQCSGCSLYFNAKVGLVPGADSQRWRWDAFKRIEIARFVDQALRESALMLGINDFRPEAPIFIGGVDHFLMGVIEGRYCSQACKERHGLQREPKRNT